MLFDFMLFEKNKYLLVFSLLFLSLFLLIIDLILESNISLADTFNTSNYDLSIEINMPSEIYLNLAYDDLFKIRNLDHENGKQERLVVVVNYWLFKQINNESKLYLNSSFSINGLNSYKTSGTGKLLLTSIGNYTLCAGINSSFFEGVLNNDYNSDNDFLCFNFSVINSSKIPCNVSLGLELSNTIINNSEQVKINNIISTEDYPYIIEYKIKDVFGDIIRLRTTENSNKKSYTPKINSKLAAYFVENELIFVACNNSNPHIKNKKLLLVLNKNYEDKTSSTSSKNDNSENGENTEKKIFDNNFVNDLEIQTIYANKIAFGDEFRVKFKIIKGDTKKTLVELFVEDKDGKKLSEISKTYVYDKYSSITVSSFVSLKKDYSLKTGIYYLVLRGLGVTKRKKIKINQLLNNQELPLNSVSKNNLKINSFYTLNKKYYPDKKINLYLNLEKEVSNKSTVNVSLMMRGDEDYFVENYFVGKKKFEVQLREGINFFTAMIIDNNTKEVYDYKELILKVFNGTIIKQDSFSKDDYNHYNYHKEKKFLEKSKKELLKNSEQLSLINNSLNKLSNNKLFDNELISSYVVKENLSSKNTSKKIFSNEKPKSLALFSLFLTVFLSLFFLLTQKS